MIPRQESTTALRATRQWLNAKASVIGGSKLPSPHSRLVVNAWLISQTKPASISNRPPSINSASIRVPSRNRRG